MKEQKSFSIIDYDTIYSLNKQMLLGISARNILQRGVRNRIALLEKECHMLLLSYDKAYKSFTDDQHRYFRDQYQKRHREIEELKQKIQECEEGIRFLHRKINLSGFN
ncbi:MAG: hypothetical protein RBT74_12450 [Tenuifilaceae bacterium]|jgi:predicted RNase H-like nuclease (RuvC/YqgF family)|nr:hypothetical protein [Tenuifilaceae bacterium]